LASIRIDPPCSLPLCGLRCSFWATFFRLLFYRGLLTGWDTRWCGELGWILLYSTFFFLDGFDGETD
jgi:hypothetical protein